MKKYIVSEYIPDMTERYPEGFRSYEEDDNDDIYPTGLRTLTIIDGETLLIEKSKHHSHIESADHKNPYWAEANYPGEGEYILYKGSERLGMIPDVWDIQKEYDLYVANMIHEEYIDMQEA